MAFSEWVRGDGFQPRGAGFGAQNAKDGLGQIYVCNPSCFIGQFANLPNADYLFQQICDSQQSGLVQQWTWKGDWWIADKFSYSHSSTPNRRSCWYSDQGLNAGRPWTGAASLVAASSRHPGGVNAAFCDGSVHWIQSTISQSDLERSRNERCWRGNKRRRLLNNDLGVRPTGRFAAGLAPFIVEISWSQGSSSEYVLTAAWQAR